jgi:hypothetical protein
VFAPLVVKPQTDTVWRPRNKRSDQSSRLRGRRTGISALHPGIGEETRHGFVPQLASRPRWDALSDQLEKEAEQPAANVAWDFSKIPVFPPGGAEPGKLAVGRVGDPGEDEVDRVANQAIRMPVPRISISAEPAWVSRKCAACKRDEQMLQTKSGGPPEAARGGVPEIVNEVLRSPGQPLDAVTRAVMEPPFRRDFSDVRIHSNARATESARTLNALAYTVGRDIVFGAGQYAPQTGGGQHLLAHELIHVVQQGGQAQALQHNNRVGEENDRYEQEAERGAALFMSGVPIQVSSMVSPALVQRTKVCSKRLEAPVLGWFFNHSYIDDTGMDNCLGNSRLGNYAIQTLVSGNFRKGCAVKTATSTDPQEYTPNVKQCDPAPGVTDLSKCLRDTYNSYPDPSLYQNPWGPNSNTFAATLAKTCCADGSSKGLGLVPGWDHDPAPPCPSPIFVAGAEPAAGGSSAGGGSSDMSTPDVGDLASA